MRRIPWPGEKLGPCLSRCDHDDCLVLREAAKAVCVGCTGLISYGSSFDVERGVACHVDCLSHGFARLSDQVLGGRALPSADEAKLEALRVMILRRRREEVA